MPRSPGTNHRHGMAGIPQGCRFSPDSAVKWNRKVLDNDEDPEPGPLRSTSYWRFLVQQCQSRLLRHLTSPWRRQAPDVLEPGTAQLCKENCATHYKIISDNRRLAGHW